MFLLLKPLIAMKWDNPWFGYKFEFFNVILQIKKDTFWSSKPTHSHSFHYIYPQLDHPSVEYIDFSKSSKTKQNLDAACEVAEWIIDDSLSCSFYFCQALEMSLEMMFVHYKFGISQAHISTLGRLKDKNLKICIIAQSESDINTKNPLKTIILTTGYIYRLFLCVEDWEQWFFLLVVSILRHKNNEFSFSFCYFAGDKTLWLGYLSNRFIRTSNSTIPLAFRCFKALKYISTTGMVLFSHITSKVIQRTRLITQTHFTFCKSLALFLLF